ncbi:unnamed protein product [Nyctereutes procyonoides]|uniref:(raccoon dog) hypothetical protein n=1 Tax=Nyctereutes procyonoides TaxID=34880 RepID=A0A811ZIW2_NYCPR|nr:unnamed protein product [Nyctereutes procyonoides]
MMAFPFHLQSCLPAAMRTLILHTKPNIRNVSNMAGVPPGAPSPWSLPTMTRDTQGSESLTSLEGYTEQLRDMVAFFLDCGFSLEAGLERVGLPRRDSAGHSPMWGYKTTVPCTTTAGFWCLLVVTVSPIPKDQLVRASFSTGNTGRPIHIGDPGWLGIKDLSKPDYADPVVCQPGDVPGFWRSLMTSLEAVSSCNTCPPVPPPEAALVLTDTLHLSRCISARSPYHRGIRHLVCRDKLLRAALSLSHACSVLLPEEMDSPPGAMALAAFLQASEKEVSMIVNLRALSLFEKFVKVRRALKTQIPVLTFQGGSRSSIPLQRWGPQAPQVFDHLVAIDHSGRAADGNYYNTRKTNIKHLVDPIDDLFLATQKIPGISSTGVSNWGGYALACEEKMLGILVHHRVWSGVSGNVGMEVDRLPFHTTHARVIQRLVDVTRCV